MDNDILLHHINGAVDDLVLVSDELSPLVPFLWPGAELRDGVGVQSLRVYLDLPEGIPIVPMDAKTFFEGMVNTEDPRAVPYRERAAGLAELLRVNLADLSVFLIGTETREVYVVGRTHSGDYAGVSARLAQR